MQKRDLVVDEVVQIDPALPIFGGCFMVVTEPKSWGAQGYVQNAGQQGVAYVRVKFEDMEALGVTAEWALTDEGEE